MRAGAIDSSILAEASGMVASRGIPDHFWVVNDSGNSPEIHLMDKEGNFKHSFRVTGTSNFDWEDLAIYSENNGEKHKLYIADIGDNYAVRDHLSIIVLEEPESWTPKDSCLTPTRIMVCKYEDGPRDAETLMVDPITEEVYIISKRERNVRLYKLNQQNNDRDTLELDFLATLPFHNVTAGDIHIHGKEILLKSYDAIFYWHRDENEDLVTTLQKQHETLKYHPEPQGESIAWDFSGDGFYTLSEYNPNKEQILYYFPREKASSGK